MKAGKDNAQRKALLPKNIKTKDDSWAFAEESRGLGNYLLACTAYSSVLKWDPEHIGALKYRCLTLIRLKRYPEAEADGFRIQQVDPLSSVGYQLRGRAFQHLQEYGKAAHEFRVALSMEPDLPVLKLKEWTDKLITLSVETYIAGIQAHASTASGSEYLQSVAADAIERDGHITAKVAALFADVIPQIAPFCTVSCVVEEELEKSSEAPEVTAAQAAQTAKNARWPIGDKQDPHDCNTSTECFPHSYVWATYTEDDLVPPIVNLVHAMPGGRREVRRYYERDDTFQISDDDDDDDKEEDDDFRKKKKGTAKGKGKGKSRHKVNLQELDADDDEVETGTQRAPILFDKECGIVLGAAWNFIKFELGGIDVGDHAVVFEVDDVLLSSYPAFKAENFVGLPPLTSKWLRRTDAPPNVPLLKFYAEMRDCGATLFIVTRRLAIYREETEQNLVAAGFHGYERLIMRPELDAYNHVPIAEFKSRARAWISRWYKIIMTVGDQQCDLTGCSVGQPIKLPNHLYIIE